MLTNWPDDNAEDVGFTEVAGCATEPKGSPRRCVTATVAKGDRWEKLAACDLQKAGICIDG
jgi:hypothetical protein